MNESIKNNRKLFLVRFRRHEKNSNKTVMQNICHRIMKRTICSFNYIPDVVNEIFRERVNRMNSVSGLRVNHEMINCLQKLNN